jgi:hypothetical protein
MVSADLLPQRCGIILDGGDGKRLQPPAAQDRVYTARPIWKRAKGLNWRSWPATCGDSFFDSA